MKNRILTLLFLIILGLAVLCPAGVFAAPLDPDADAGLTLYYTKDQKAFPELQISIYRIAEAFPNGTFELIEPYSSYPINIHDITAQEQWYNIAETLDSYIVANRLNPDRKEKTDADGTVRFSDLETGLYFVSEAAAEDADATYLFNQFLVYIPTPNADGSYNYVVEAKPKCTEHTPQKQYTVTKLWQDTGNKDRRPKEIVVNIYKNGTLQEQKILSAANNWSYKWNVPADDSSKWTVAESVVPDKYNVTIQQNQGVFSIINAYQPPSEQPPPKPPKTGDSSNLIPWIIALSASGIVLLILGIYTRRWK